MPYIKVPEFKHNETISSAEFNNAFEEFKSLELDGENFADESIGFYEVPSDISLTNKEKITISSFKNSGMAMRLRYTGSLNPFKTPGSVYTNRRTQATNHPANNLISLQNITGNERFIIRASCRVYVPDGGWRTYYHGIPPTFRIGLVQFPGESSISDGSSSALTKPIDSTVAHFRVAFTGKVPSASQLSEEAAADLSGVGAIEYRDRTKDVLFSYSDTRGGDVDSPDDSRDGHLSRKFMPFGAHHSYTTAYLYEPDASENSTQSFGLMCFFSGGDSGVSGSDTVSSGQKGAFSPDAFKTEAAIVYDLHLFVYEVKK